jgi:hypothetical protein
MRYKMLGLLVLMLSARLLKADLIADVTVTAGPPVWSYTLINNELLDSPNFITSFSLTVDAPIIVTGTPTGWDFSTDDATYVFWYNTDPALPYPHDVAPGASLGGFSISSTATSSELLSYGLSGWDHSLDQPGPTVAGTVLSPSSSATVPEPNSVYLLLGAMGFLAVKRRHANRR